MKTEGPRLLRAVTALWVAVIFAFYLAPTSTKYEMADLLAAALLMLALVVLGMRRFGWSIVVEPVTPLLALLTYVAVQASTHGPWWSWPYAQQLLFGFLPYMLLYLLFCRESTLQKPSFLVVVFILPGLLHMAYMYFDIGLAIQREEMAFMTSSKHGFLEYVKDAPRVGRRYLSVALLHLLCGALLMAWHFRLMSARRWTWALSEPPRVLRRLQPLREWSHEQDEQVFPRSPGACGAASAGISG